jgi:hypothetical protein
MHGSSGQSDAQRQPAAMDRLLSQASPVANVQAGPLPTAIRSAATIVRPTQGAFQAAVIRIHHILTAARWPSGFTRGARPHAYRRLLSAPSKNLDGRAPAAAFRTSSRAAQPIACGLGALPNDPWRESRRRAVLAALTVDPHPWRNPPEVGESGDGCVGLPHHPHSMELFAPAGKPLALVARPLPTARYC